MVGVEGVDLGFVVVAVTAGVVVVGVGAVEIGELVQTDGCGGQGGQEVGGVGAGRTAAGVGGAVVDADGGVALVGREAQKRQVYWQTKEAE